MLHTDIISQTPAFAHALTGAEPAAMPTFRDLPFIKDGQWAPRKAANYSAACQLGREYADAMLELITTTGNPLIYSGVMRCMIASGRYEGVEIGFCHRVAEAFM